MAAIEGTDVSTAKRVSAAWVILFIVGMFGVAWIADTLAISSTWKLVASLSPMLLLIPMVRAIEKSQRACGSFSPAMHRYNRRVLTWSFAYVILLVGAIMANRTWHLSGPLAWAIAVLPALPILFFIWSMGAYVAEESDEYLRQRAIMSALWATGFLLAVATCYGFLETFKLVPHVEGWAAVPVWAAGLALGNLISRRSA